MRTMTTTRWALLSGFMMLFLTACSGAEGVGDASQPPGAEAHADDDGVTAQPDGPGRGGPARFIERFDKDGNGTVEIVELPDRMKARLAKADTNADGRLTTDELKAAGASRAAEIWKHADKNGDGALTSDEVGEERFNHLKVADANNDARITADELKQAHADGKLNRGFDKGHGPGRRHGPPMEPEKLIERLDANKNGALEASELPERMGKMLAQADANHDGKVTADELKQHAASRPERGPGRPDHRRGRGDREEGAEAE